MMTTGSADEPPRMSDVEPAPFPHFLWIWNTLNNTGTPAHHRRIARWLDVKRSSNETRLLLMCFRGAGKSTVVGLYCAWLLATDPALRLIVLSAETTLASKMVRSVRQIIRRHPLCRHIRPRGPSEWAADRFTVHRPGAGRDPSMLARGITANITGSRADVVIVDDVEVPNTSDTATEREELRERLAEIEFVLVPGGTTLFIGTPHTEDSIYADAGRDGAEPYLAGFARLRIPLLDGGGNSAWPDRFTPATIAAMQRRVGPRAFGAQMQLEPQPPQDARLDPQAMVRYDGELTLHAGNGGMVLRLGETQLVSASCFWDPAFGAPDKGDHSVLAAVFTDAEGNHYLHRVAYMTHDPKGGDDAATQLCRQVAMVARELHLPSVTVENNGIGRFLPGLLRAEMARARVPCAVVERASTRGKTERILGAIEPVLAARRLWVHRAVLAGKFAAEMREWRPGPSSKGAHDDALDAVAGCLLAEPVRLPRAMAAERSGWRGGGGAYGAETGFTP